jgi:beta-1,4-mannosyl-glycoprotein beta-1,4-N-acetylglucosaminyltransferase
MLELRLQELYPVVDKFVLVEGARTFQHEHKPSYFLINRHRFSRYLDKIIHVRFNDDIPVTPVEERGAHHFLYEIPQRNAILRGLNGADVNDVATVCDVDEIPSRETMVRLSQGISKTVRFHLQMHYYTFNHLYDGSWWLATASTVGSLMLRTPNDMRLGVREEDEIWENAGWHMSFFGPNEFIQRKLSDCGEGSLNKPEFISDENLDAARENGLDFAHRPECTMKILDEPPSLPKTVSENRGKYEKLGWFMKKSTHNCLNNASVIGLRQ